MADPARPGNIIGGRDYMGPCQPEVDPDCDRLVDPPNACLPVFDSGPQYHPANLNTLPGLALYGRSVYSFPGVSLNDRVKVLTAEGTLGTVATGPLIPELPNPPAYNTAGVFMHNDTYAGKLISMETLLFGHRYAVSSIETRPGTIIYTQNGLDLSAITSYTANVAPLIFQAPPVPAVDNPLFILQPNQEFPSPGQIVAPASHIGTLILNAGSVLRLGVGRYFVDNLTVEPGAEIQIDHTGGYTEIYVTGSINFQGRIVSTGGHDCNTLLAYLGTNRVHINGLVNGTLIAPDAPLVLNSTTYGTGLEHRGAYYSGRSVEVHQGITVQHCPMLCN